MPNIERPILILPTSDAPERAKKPGGPSRIARPNLRRQQERLNPQFQRLQDAFENRRVSLQNNPDGIEPELALVIVTVGSSANFLSAVKRIEGLEWLAETGLDGIEPDDDFFDQDNRKKELSGKYYCIMSALSRRWYRFGSDIRQILTWNLRRGSLPSKISLPL